MKRREFFRLASSDERSPDAEDSARLERMSRTAERAQLAADWLRDFFVRRGSES